MFFTYAEVCIDGQKASAVLFTSNRIFIHQAMIAISSSNMNFHLNLKRKVNLVVLNVSRSEPLMPFATVAVFGRAATILAAHASSYVSGTGQLMCIRHYAVAVAYAQNLKSQMITCMCFRYQALSLFSVATLNC